METESPTLILGKQFAAIHFLQTKTITAKKIVESKRDPDLVTVAVDLNVKQLAVITVRQHGSDQETRFVSDHGLDHHRLQHLKRVAKKQWQTGNAVKGEHSNQQLWRHVRRQHGDARTKPHELLSRYARSILAACWSLNGYGRSNQLEAPSRGDSTASKPIN